MGATTLSSLLPSLHRQLFLYFCPHYGLFSSVPFPSFCAISTLAFSPSFSIPPRLPSFHTPFPALEASYLSAPSEHHDMVRSSLQLWGIHCPLLGSLQLGQQSLVQLCQIMILSDGAWGTTLAWVQVRKVPLPAVGKQRLATACPHFSDSFRRSSLMRSTSSILMGSLCI